jgi:two-component system NtrC family response regulator
MIFSIIQAKERPEKEMIVFALEKQQGSVIKTAEILGVSRSTFYDFMRKHGLHQV